MSCVTICYIGMSGRLCIAYSLGVLVPVLCKMNIQGSQAMVMGQGFLRRQQNGVNPMMASFMLCVIWNLGCRSGCMAVLVQSALGLPATVAGADI